MRAALSTREAPWTPSAWGFIWRWSHKHCLPGMSPNFHSPRWEVGVQHKPHCLFRQPRNRQLLVSIWGVLGTLPSSGPRCRLRAAGLTSLCRVAAPVSTLSWSLWCLGPLEAGRSLPARELCAVSSLLLFLLHPDLLGPVFFFLFNVLCCGHKVERLGSGHFSRTAVSSCLCVCSVTCVQKSAQMINPRHFQKLNSPHLRVGS